MTAKKKVKKTSTTGASHPLIDAAEAIVAGMPEHKQRYWSAEARKRNYTLTQMVAKYLFADFDIPVEGFEEYFKKKRKDNASEIVV